jgi:hypothetical protein
LINYGQFLWNIIMGDHYDFKKIYGKNIRGDQGKILEIFRDRTPHSGGSGYATGLRP